MVSGKRIFPIRSEEGWPVVARWVEAELDVGVPPVSVSCIAETLLPVESPLFREILCAHN